MRALLQNSHVRLNQKSSSTLIVAEAYLSVTAVWADPDLIEIAVVARFEEWGGGTRAYVTRGELRTFAAELDAVSEGAVGAQLVAGQRKTHAARLGRLERRGFSAEQIARIRGPVGLRIGARSPAEIAVSILAQIVETLRVGDAMKGGEAPPTGDAFRGGDPPATP